MSTISTNRLAVDYGPAAVTSIVVAFLALLIAAPAAQAPSKGKSAATITGAFADSCRDFIAHSSKDISYVELHYLTGLVVRDESVNSPDHAIDGGAGAEIESATVKSGTTTEEFHCVPSNAAPTALLEINTPPINQVLGCYEYFSGSLFCEQSSPRTAWTNSSQFPHNGGTEEGILLWGCGAVTHPSLCSSLMKFRLSGSSDPDGDLATWTLDFGDGTSVSGTWSGLPAEVAHDYPTTRNCISVNGNGVCTITLTVTDSAGQSDSDVIPIAFVDLTPN